MTIEQKQLLDEITKWHSREFSNRMDDHWTDKNYAFARECKQTIGRLEKEYVEKYGELPEWKYIDDVWDAMEQLKEELLNEAVGGK